MFVQFVSSVRPSVRPLAIAFVVSVVVAVVVAIVALTHNFLVGVDQRASGILCPKHLAKGTLSLVGRLLVCYLISWFVGSFVGSFFGSLVRWLVC